MKNRILNKLTGIVLTGAMLVTGAAPVFATGTQTLDGTTTTGTIRVYANVASSYHIQLPASIRIREACYDYEAEKSYESPDGTTPKDSAYREADELKFEGDYGVNVYGVLLGQKVTIKPANDTFTMNAYEDSACTTPSTNPALTLSVAQPTQVWIPSTETAVAGQAVIAATEAEDEGDYAGQGHMSTSVKAKPDTYYKGTVTFEVTCEDL